MNIHCIWPRAARHSSLPPWLTATQELEARVEFVIVAGGGRGSQAANRPSRV